MIDKHAYVLDEKALVAIPVIRAFLSYCNYGMVSKSKPLAYGGVAALFRRLKKRTGIDGKRVSAHNCRRYMATKQLADGRSPLDGRRPMGHRTLSMTNKYASLTIKPFEEIA